MDEYATDQGRFSMHSCNLVNPYVELSTGSLGHGLLVACSMAVALRLKQNYINRVYTIMGDGEQSEGSIWEAVANAKHSRLGNLIAIVDYNGLEADGAIAELTSFDNLAEKYNAFGWNVVEIDGHDITEIKDAFDKLTAPDSDTPTVIIAHTIKGKGVSFMENQVRWHAGKITNAQLEDAIYVLEQQFLRKWIIDNE